MSAEGVLPNAPGLPKRGDSEWVTSPVQGWRAQGGSEQWVNRRGGQN